MLNSATLASGTIKRNSSNSAYGPVKMAQTGRARAAPLDLACRGTPSVRVGSVVIRRTPPPDASSSQQPQVGWVDENLHRLRRNPVTRGPCVLQRPLQHLAGGELEIETQILAQIGHRDDARRKAIVFRRPAIFRCLDLNAFRPDQYRDLRTLAGCLAINGTAQSQTPLGHDGSFFSAAFDNRRRQQVRAADKLGDTACRRPLVDLAGRSDRLDPSVGQNGDAVG